MFKWIKSLFANKKDEKEAYLPLPKEVVKVTLPRRMPPPPPPPAKKFQASNTVATPAPDPDPMGLLNPLNPFSPISVHRTYDARTENTERKHDEERSRWDDQPTQYTTPAHGAATSGGSSHSSYSCGDSSSSSYSSSDSSSSCGGGD